MIQKDWKRVKESTKLLFKLRVTYLVNKNEFPIGQDLEDQKYLTKCSDFYHNYDNCLRKTEGDFLNCKMFRK